MEHDRPDPNDDVQIAKVTAIYRVDTVGAKRMLRFALVIYHAARAEGRAEAQRFFRLAMGIEAPEPEERAYWNHPVPLKKDAGDEQS